MRDSLSLLNIGEKRKSFISYLNKGLDFEKVGLLDEAIIFYKKAREIFPNHVRVQVFIGNLLSQKGRNYDALNCGNSAMMFAKSKKDKWRASLLIAQSNFGIYKLTNQLNNLDTAIFYLEKAITKIPKNIYPFTNLIVSFLEKSEFFYLKNLSLKSRSAEKIEPEKWAKYWNEQLKKRVNFNLNFDRKYLSGLIEQIKEYLNTVEDQEYWSSQVYYYSIKLGRTEE